MLIRILTTDYLESHCYIVVEGEHAFVVDPGDGDLVTKALSDMKVTVDFGILTHEHCDHIYGCSAVRDAFGCRMISSSICNTHMQSSRKNSSQYFEAFVGVQTKCTSGNLRYMPPFTTFADEVFEGEKRFSWMGHEIYMRETPGHSKGSICILVDNEILFTGDSLFKDEVVETHFSGGSETEFQEITMPWIKGLPGDVMVYPGHGDEFRLSYKFVKV